MSGSATITKAQLLLNRTACLTIKFLNMNTRSTGTQIVKQIDCGPSNNVFALDIKHFFRISLPWSSILNCADNFSCEIDVDWSKNSLFVRSEMIG